MMKKQINQNAYVPVFFYVPKYLEKLENESSNKNNATKLANRHGIFVKLSGYI